jgi:hypothetical protein
VPVVLLILGLSLVAVGLAFALGGVASDAAGGSALKGIKVEGPSWLILVAIGVGVIIFSAVWEFSEDGDSPPPTTTTTTTTTVDFGLDGDRLDFIPFTLGDDPDLDLLWFGCQDGFGVDCDDLFALAPFDSDYEAFGGTCGFRFEFVTEEPCSNLDLFAEATNP